MFDLHIFDKVERYGRRNNYKTDHFYQIFLEIDCTYYLIVDDIVNFENIEDYEIKIAEVLKDKIKELTNCLANVNLTEEEPFKDVNSVRRFLKEKGLNFICETI